MISLKVIFGILIIHWIANFVLQTDKQAKGKSKNWTDLLSHTINYSAVWFLLVILLFPNGWSTGQYVLNALLFASTTFVLHTATDYFTSRLNSKLWEQGKVHYFFVSVGFDQILHYIQLILTFYFIVN